MSGIFWPWGEWVFHTGRFLEEQCGNGAKQGESGTKRGENRINRSAKRRRKSQAECRRICWKRDKGKCWLCRVTHRKWDADHIVPWSFGGSDDADNLRTLCKDCHKSETWEMLHGERGRELRRKQLHP